MYVDQVPFTNLVPELRQCLNKGHTLNVTNSTTLTSECQID